MNNSLNSTEKAMSALAYLGILFFLPLVVCPDSHFGKYHANQGLILFIAGVVVNIAARVSRIIPLIGEIVISACNLLLFVFMILGIINALNGREEPLPIIGSYTIIK